MIAVPLTSAEWALLEKVAGTDLTAMTEHLAYLTKKELRRLGHVIVDTPG